MKNQLYIQWRQEFEERVSQLKFDDDDEVYDEIIRKMLVALLDSENWQKDRGDDAIFTANGRLIRNEDNLAEELWWAFWHQNTRYPRTLIVVPILSEMLPHVAATNQPFLIDYLANIALGATDWHLEHGFRPARTRGAYMDDKLGIALHAAVQKYSVPHFLKLAIASTYSRTRASSLWVLGWFPALHENTLSLLNHAAQHDSDDLVQDAAKFALSMLEKAARQPEDFDDSIWNDPDEKLQEEHLSLLLRLNDWNG